MFSENTGYKSSLSRRSNPDSMRLFITIHFGQIEKVKTNFLFYYERYTHRHIDIDILLVPEKRISPGPPQH